MPFQPMTYADLPEWIREHHLRADPMAPVHYADWDKDSLWSLARELPDGTMAMTLWTENEDRWVACTLVDGTYQVWAYTRTVDRTDPHRWIEHIVDDPDAQTFTDWDAATKAIDALTDQEDEAYSLVCFTDGAEEAGDLIVSVPAAGAKVRPLAHDAYLNTELGLIHPSTGERVLGRVLNVIHWGEPQMTMRVGLGESLSVCACGCGRPLYEAHGHVARSL